MATINGTGLGIEFGRACRDVRRRLDLGLREVAAAARISPSYLGRLERGLANPTFARAVEIATVLGMAISLEVTGPIVLGAEPLRRRDTVHASCSGFVGRRLRRAGWIVLREVLFADGPYRGWIDILAFDPVTGRMLIIEIKTRLDDLGAIERQVGWYERNAGAIARSNGWSVTSTMTLLLVLASEENERTISAARDVLGQAFPIRTEHLSAEPGDGRRGLAMIDPRSRGSAWLHRPIVDGRRTRAPYRDYADAAARLRSARDG